MDPFYTTKETGDRDLVCPSHLKIVQAHGGELLLTNREAGGAVASIRLPLGRQGPGLGKTKGRARCLKVLIVDDDHNFREDAAGAAV